MHSEIRLPVPLQLGTASQRDTEAPGHSVPAPQSNGSTLQTAAFPPRPPRLLKQRKYFRTWVQPLGCHGATQPDYLGRGIFIGHERQRNSFPAAPPRRHRRSAQWGTAQATPCWLASAPSTPQPYEKPHCLPSESSQNPTVCFWGAPLSGPRAQASP